jgi:AMIN domain
LSRIRAWFYAPILMVCAVVCNSARTPVEVRSVTILPENDTSTIAIISSGPLTPKLQVVENPLRLVIDVRGAMQSSVRKKIPLRNDQIKGIRISQNQPDPPVTRIVVDLAGPVLYTWDALGNRLNIRVRADQAATAKPASVPALSAGVEPIAVPYAEGSGGTLVEAGNRVAAGSSITAKEETAVLRLSRGGEVKVCPGTTVSVSTSQSGKDLLLGMSTGAMETHYRLEESSDSVLTPDFRIVLPGPGEFDFAISADSHGNTCVGSMPGSSASVVVAELLGNGTYEIKPSQEILFRQGRLDTVEHPEGPCGCPSRQEPVLTASNTSAPVIPEEQAGTKLQMANSSDPRPSGDTPATTAVKTVHQPGNESEPAQTKDADMQIQLEAPLVFSGREIAEARKRSAPAPPTAAVSALPLSSKAADPLPATIVLPPQTPKPQGKGFFGGLKSFFGAIFR